MCKRSIKCLAKVFRQKIFMRHYGGKSVKPTCLWSNSWRIQKVDQGPLTKDMASTAEPLATTYTDRKGKKTMHR